MASIFTVLIAGIHYLIHPQKLATIQETINPDALIPVTLLTTDELFGDLEGTLQLFDLYDDVFTPEFASVLVEKSGSNSSSGLARCEAEAGLAQEVYHLEVPVSVRGFDELPSGPYILYGPNLYQAWRLYEDELDAFTFGVIPEDVNSPNEYIALSSLSPSGAHKAIPVPSRLYQTPPTTTKPLSGIRISISDTFSLKGVHTTLSSRAWTELYTAASESTASFVQKLIELGAVIVGKTKTSQFDAGKEWVDVAAPWNPRADGYQQPGGTSAGSGSALAGYDWLQRAVANDALTGGREVAALGGLHSIRTSLDSVSTDGHISSGSYDTATFSARHIKDLYTLTKASLNATTVKATLPKKLLVPGDFDLGWSSEQRALHDKFIAVIENLLAVKAESINLASVWADNPPSEAGGHGMDEYLTDAFFRSLSYEFYHEYNDFRAAYHDTFDRQAFVEATVKYKWDTGKHVTKDEYAESLIRINVYRRWFDTNIMPLNSKNGSDTVMILPFGTAEPHYRIDRPGKPKPIEGITSRNLAPILQTPHLIVPFAQLPYDSVISGNTEYLPVIGSILGARGSDLALIQVAKQAFELAQWRTSVDAGRLTFPLGKSARNVDDRLEVATGLRKQEIEL